LQSLTGINFTDSNRYPSKCVNVVILHSNEDTKLCMRMTGDLHVNISTFT